MPLGPAPQLYRWVGIDGQSAGDVQIEAGQPNVAQLVIVEIAESVHEPPRAIDVSEPAEHLP